MKLALNIIVLIILIGVMYWLITKGILFIQFNDQMFVEALKRIFSKY